jgi:hypothetical protein
VNKKKHFKKIVGKKSCGKKKWFFLKKKTDSDGSNRRYKHGIEKNNYK